jgi:hypothetical protein
LRSSENEEEERFAFLLFRSSFFGVITRKLKRDRAFVVVVAVAAARAAASLTCGNHFSFLRKKKPRMKQKNPFCFLLVLSFFVDN